MDRRTLLETFIILLTGVVMHLKCISIIELKQTNLPLLTPNVASSLVNFSVLCVLSKMRPLWPAALRKPQRLVVFGVEMAVILYVAEFLLRQVWLPLLKLLNFICRFMSQYVIVVNNTFLANNVPALSGWIRDQGYYLARFLLAVGVFVLMIETCGVFEYFGQNVRDTQTMMDNVSNFVDEPRNNQHLVGVEEESMPQAPPNVATANDGPSTEQNE